VPPPTGRVGPEQFLRLGAGVGVVGWTGTQTLAWVDPPGSGAVAIALWVALVGVMTGVGLRHCTDALRFSTPLLVWGTVNAAAMTLTVVATLGDTPNWLAVPVWQVWVLAAAVGYGGTAVSMHRAGREWELYAVAGVLETVLLAVGVLAPGAVAAAPYLLVGLLHAMPLLVDAERSRLDYATRRVAAVETGLFLVALVAVVLV
jgi:hypothetical protein